MEISALLSSAFEVRTLEAKGGKPLSSLGQRFNCIVSVLPLAKLCY